jgi:hypothetical protein
MKTLAIIACVCAVALAACNGSDPEIEKQATSSGFSQQAAAEIARMNLTKDEMESVAKAKSGGMDDASILKMVKSLHDRDLKFDIGFDLQLFNQQGLGATALIQLVEMGAIPRWSDDIRALKDARVSDVTIIEMAKLRFIQKKEMLSGGEYGQLKTFGLSDAGLLSFAQHGGTRQQFQKLAETLALGKPEPEALKSIGM